MNSSARDHIRKEVLIGGLSNAFFNGWIAWLLMREGPDLAWSGQHSFVPDVLATAFLLPLIVALIVIPLQRSKLRKGKLEVIELTEGSWLHALVQRFPRGVGKSSLLFGLIGVAVFAPLILLCVFAAGVDSFTPAVYAAFKGVWAGAIAGALVILMVLVALREPVEVTATS